MYLGDEKKKKNSYLPAMFATSLAMPCCNKNRKNNQPVRKAKKEQLTDWPCNTNVRNKNNNNPLQKAQQLTRTTINL